MKRLLYILIILLIISCRENTKENSSNELSLWEEQYLEDLYRSSYAVSPNKTDTDTLSKTKLYPYIEAPIKKDLNSLYCISFQLAWNELIKHNGGEIALANSSNSLLLLNKSKISKKDIDDNSIICAAGKNMISQIKKDFKTKFNYVPEHIDNLSDNLIVFAYLQKILKFEGEFKTDQVDKINFKNQNSVWYFYYLIDTISAKTNNVLLHDYKSANDFIIKVKVKEKNDEVYFAKVKPESTLFETYKAVMKRVHKNNLFKLETNDMIGIPYVSINMRKDFDYLSGNILNSNGEKIEHAIQDVDFDLNETGITLISSVAITRQAFDNNGKKLLFNKPFLVILKQRYSDYPYFLLWVENSELMKENIY